MMARPAVEYQRSFQRRAAARQRAQLVITTLAGSRQAGVSGARQLEIRQIPVTWATPAQSILYARALRDAALFGGLSAPVVGLGTGWQGDRGSLQQAYNRLPTCLQLPCNQRDTPALLRHCYGVAWVPLRGHDGVPRAERQRSRVVRAPPPVVVMTRYAPAQLSPPVAWGCAFSALGHRVASLLVEAEGIQRSGPQIVTSSGGRNAGMRGGTSVTTGYGTTKRKYCWLRPGLYRFVYVSTPNWSKRLDSTGVQRSKGSATFVLEYSMKFVPELPPTPLRVRRALEMTGEQSLNSYERPLAVKPYVPVPSV